MVKADLKSKWGHYCDTDKLVDDVMNLLTKYHHRNTEHGVCALLDTYFTNKSPLIDMFKKSGKYVGDMRIITDIELERGIDANEVRQFCRGFIENVEAKSVVLKDKNDEGKTISDYIKVGIASFKAKDLLSKDFCTRFGANSKQRNEFESDGFTVESHNVLNALVGATAVFSLNPRSTLSEDTIDGLKQCKINGNYAAGMKTSRAFNRMCTEYKINTLPNYNRLYARYADMVSGLKRKLKFFISLNPLDYLTMSFGNSWASCHTIDKRNERGMPNDYSGMYCGGTVSYMLDKSSIITYIHSGIPDNVEEGKLYRNMFHYEDGALIQSRIYPQGNDGATDLYKEFRSVVHKEFADMLGIDNQWLKRSGNFSRNITSSGCHYQDYYHFSSCNMTYPCSMYNAPNSVVHIGHNRICVQCGETIDEYAVGTGRLNHVSCN